jgi:hypothetical protein
VEQLSESYHLPRGDFRPIFAYCGAILALPGRVFSYSGAIFERMKSPFY